jgi:molybdopterin synthase catalytic subunit
VVARILCAPGPAAAPPFRYTLPAMFLTDAAIDSTALARSVMRPSDGACVLFEGVVRNHHEGRSVESIFYDAYRPMAEKELARIVSELSTQFPAVAIALQHRLGLLHVGDPSIVIVCSSPHRGDSFEACRALIDRVKETVPIWKKERGEGGEEWVGWQK